MKGLYYFTGIVLACFILLITISLRASKKTTGNLHDKDAGGFVVMELFTSQGCSSCPPADEILGMYVLKNDDHIIPLAFHVDYWNRLGWVDPFSNSTYSQRQRDYAEKFSLESIYTPQLIINGQKQLVGSDKDKIAAITNDFLKEKATVVLNITAIKLTGDKVLIDYSINNTLPNMTVNAALVQKNVITQIKAGENRGIKLNNYNVVRDFKTKHPAGSTGNFILQIPDGYIPANYQVVLFVQENASGIIRGAVKQNCK